MSFTGSWQARVAWIACAPLVVGCTTELGSGRDSGATGDGGGTMDSAVPRDAGTGPDATMPVDANVRLDAMAEPDGGSTMDTGGGPDGGPTLVCFPAAVDCTPSSVTMEDGCFDGTSCYLRMVQNGVRNVIRDRPELFMMGASCSIILDVDQFMDAVVAQVVGMGVCAIRDPNAPGEEVTVKTGNDFTENFDIVASTGCARYGDPIYTSTCTPAWW